MAAATGTVTPGVEASELRNRRTRVLIAEDGASGLAAARAAPPDLVVLDWMMPGLSGLDLCRALRSDPVTAGAMIVMVTARVLLADRDAALAAGADHFVGKPFSPVALLDTVRHAL